MPRKDWEPLTQVATENSAVMYVPIKMPLYLFTRAFAEEFVGRRVCSFRVVRDNTKLPTEESASVPPTQSCVRRASFLALAQTLSLPVN